MHPESETGSGNRHCDQTVMANSDMVPTFDGNSGGYTNYNLETAHLLQLPYQDGFVTILKGKSINFLQKWQK
ncbi:hypothetical protein DPMN_013314 [Dreissena polymorpha]|uniref:Uncharacterized protein n=1 Tax=Dreissena polymorpha TaxID=45954 RepID=A0A9D4S2C4_DREPO|nr:hypothetical protein DPMN_013314 [Dreissena polymorpha]